MTTEPRRRRARLRWSVFAKLALIMVVMAASLVTIFATVFWRLVVPAIHESSRQLAIQFARQAATHGLDRDSAMELAATMNLAVRYEGPAGDWNTNPADPLTIDQAVAMAAGHSHAVGQQSRVIFVKSGEGRYMFTWDFAGRMRRIERVLFTATASAMLLVIVTTYLVLKRLLRPVQALSKGVSRLGAGDLEIVLPASGSDEFGQLTAAFNQMAARVREMVRARDQLLVDVSHELRSPLTRLRVAVALLPDGDKRRQLSDDLVEMESMIAELLELERLRDGNGVRLERADLVPLLEETARPFQGRFPGVEVHAETSPLPAAFDHRTMRVVVRNLLDNAVKYSLPDSRAIRVVARARGGGIEVRITDNGPGIAAADVASVFEPFFRLDRSRSRRTGGYGLGLSICKRIIEAHHGTIEIEPAEERGAAFVLNLPSA